MNKERNIFDKKCEILIYSIENSSLDWIKSTALWVTCMHACILMKKMLTFAVVLVVYKKYSLENDEPT